MGTFGHLPPEQLTTKFLNTIDKGEERAFWDRIFGRGTFEVRMRIRLGIYFEASELNRLDTFFLLR